MSNARIVTDSTAELPSEIVEELNITVVPWRIQIGQEVLVDGPALWSTPFYRRMIKRRLMPSPLAPTARQFAEAYAKLAQETDDIVSIHPSSHLATVVDAARQGRMSLLGRCQVNVIDSRFISRALGILVTEGAEAAQMGASGSEVLRLVHGMIPRTYFAFYLETMEYLRRREKVPGPRDLGTLGSGMSGFKPLLLLEEGEIVPLPRSRKRGDATERLIEFIAEFQAPEQLFILHTGLAPRLADFKAQLAESLPKQPATEHIYGPVLASYIGPTALGVVVFQN